MTVSRGQGWRGGGSAVVFQRLAKCVDEGEPAPYYMKILVCLCEPSAALTGWMLSRSTKKKEQA